MALELRFLPKIINFDRESTASGRNLARNAGGEYYAVFKGGLSQDDSGRARAVQAEASRAEARRAELSQAEPSWASPGQARPSRAGPSQPEPSQTWPSAAKPSRAEPSRSKLLYCQGNDILSLPTIISQYPPRVKTPFPKDFVYRCQADSAIYIYIYIYVYIYICT